MSKTDSLIRIGIVGAGANTRAMHIPRLRAIANVELRAVANRRPESTAKAAADFAIGRTYATWQELVAAPDIDAVVIGTWPYLHEAVTVAALAAGKHILCEARMAMDLASAQRMLAAAAARPDLVAQIVPSPMTLHVDRTISRLLAEGYVGRLLAIEVVAHSGKLADAAAPLHWRQDITLSGLNTLSLGIWYEAITRWIGAARQVYAQGRIAVPQRRDAVGAMRQVAVPDYLSVNATFADGVAATMLLSNVSGGPAREEVVLIGDAGRLRLNNKKLYGIRQGDTAEKEIAIPAAEAVGWRVEEEFIGAIRGQEKVKLTTFADGVKYMAFTEAVSRSISESKVIIL